MHARRRVAALVAIVILALSACGGSEASGPPAVAPDDWAAVRAAAQGQTVNWYMYGGDDTLNGFVTGYVADRLRDEGVTLNQVKVTDTADAVNKVLGERQAGRLDSGGSVDAIWVNGENFATGVQAGIWSCGWAPTLPNARYIDGTDPAIKTDFGVPVDGCEAAWQRADSALVYNSADLTDDDVRSVPTLFDWVRAHPGRFTYPAPPDFTGSLAVRQIFYDTIGGPTALPVEFEQDAYQTASATLWPRLNDIEDSLWRGGETYPQSQNDVEKLYANGEISAFFTYGPGAVGDQVDRGVYPASTREAVLAGGNISNVSFVGIPANAEHRAAALVLANLLQDPATQLALYRAEGIYPAIDLQKAPADILEQFADVPVSASVLPLADLTADTQPELATGYVDALERDWTREVLQR